MSIIEKIKALPDGEAVWSTIRTDFLCQSDDLIALAESHERLLKIVKDLEMYDYPVQGNAASAIAEAEKI
jgi:hypothetical protein